MPDIRETMGAIWDRDNTPAPKAEPVSDPIAAPSPEAAPEPVSRETAPPAVERGSDGRFLPKQETQTVEPEKVPVATEPKAEPAPDKPAAAALPPSAPATWSATAKAEWAKLPPAIQQEVLKREGDVSKGFAERAEAVKAYEAIERTIGDRKSRMLAQYGSVEAGLNDLLRASDFAAADPVGFVRWFAQQRGVDLAKLLPATSPAEPSASSDDGWVDPRLAQVQQELKAVTQSIAQREAAEREQLMAQLHAMVETFKASGKAPHFEDVRQDMASLARIRPELTIDQLYERSVYANPTTRERVLAEQRATQEKIVAEANARKAEEAKRMQRINVGTRGATGASPTTPLSKRETMERVYDNLNSG